MFNLDDSVPLTENTTRLNSALGPNHVHLTNQVLGARSDAKERDILAAEVASLRLEMTHPDVDSKIMATLLARALFCHTLGHDVSGFAAIKAVMLTQDAKTEFEKQVAYLCVSMFLHQGHELSLLMVNTFQKALGDRTTSQFEVSAALNTLGGIASADMVPALLPFVLHCARGEESPTIRMRAIFILKRFVQLVPNCLDTHPKSLKRALADSDVGVMSAVLALYSELIERDPKPYLSLFSAFVHIFGQVVAGKIPNLDFQGVPAPWVQTRTLHIISALADADPQLAQSSALPLLRTAFILAVTLLDRNPYHAVLCESLRGLRRIAPHLEADCAKELAVELRPHVDKLVAYRNENRRAMGTEGKALLMELDPAQDVNQLADQVAG
ncbi:AP-4 complex subunit epsilon-1 [Geranomyces variabilis]|uniref:AP-4 complex subunit epsilon-1 n=1 Tax=Geranomyces variabilis TaxID=109894 RepID=A0AAD5TP25_9FUNG|nr:AP-4 complex subunit epsilon-1 [Geranomyces variabilis]